MGGGNPDGINPKAFINAHNFSDFDALIAEIKRIDNDDNAFRAMIKEPVFLHNRNPFAEYEAKLEEFLSKIVAQKPEDALRRGHGQMLHYHEQIRLQYAKMHAFYNKYKLHSFRKIAKFFLKS